MRCAQALAANDAAGVEVARELLHSKVAGQASLLRELRAPSGTEGIFERALDMISAAIDLRSLLAAEAEAANAYWASWSTLPVPIAGRDPEAIPEHWRTFGTRHSILSNGPRLACNPPNAILNYLYALLEGETILACHAVGLDPMLGIFHTDQRYRSSLALDVMEPVRPIVDAYVLALLTQRTLAGNDFIETRHGNCRITPRLAGCLAATVENWQHQIAPVVEGIAHLLNRTATNIVQLGAPLTRAQHRAAWEERAQNGRSRRSTTSTPVLPNTCRDCGTHLPDRRKRYCDECRARRWARHAAQGRDNAASVLVRMRAEQRDPAHGGRAAEIRGAKNAAHQAAVRTWKGERPDAQVFTHEILPRLRSIPVADLVTATGLSEHYCSLIRLGKKIPHPRHWDAFHSVMDRSKRLDPLDDRTQAAAAKLVDPGRAQAQRVRRLTLQTKDRAASDLDRGLESVIDEPSIGEAER